MIASVPKIPQNLRHDGPPGGLDIRITIEATWLPHIQRCGRTD
jgi:hypothetical protein